MKNISPDYFRDVYVCGGVVKSGVQSVCVWWGSGWLGFKQLILTQALY